MAFNCAYVYIIYYNWVKGREVHLLSGGDAIGLIALFSLHML